MRVLFSAAIGAAALILLGCEAVVVKHVPVTDSVSRYEGISYFFPKGLVDLTIKSEVKTPGNPDTQTVTLSIDALRYVPDPTHQYQVTVKHNALYNDDITVTVDERFLLKGVNSIMEDKTPEIIQRLAEAPGQILAAPGAASTGSPERFDIKATIDPTDDGHVAMVNAILSKLSPNIVLNTAPVVAEARYKPKYPPRCETHICFPTAMPWRIDVSTGASATKFKVWASQIVVMPNKNILGSIPIERAAFVKKEFVLAFTNGMLTSVQTKNPSEVLGFISIPINVAKAIVSIPSAMLKFETTQINADNNLLTAQQKNLDLQRQIIETQQKLLLAQKSQGNS